MTPPLPQDPREALEFLAMEAPDALDMLVAYALEKRRRSSTKGWFIREWGSRSDLSRDTDLDRAWAALERYKLAKARRGCMRLTRRGRVVVRHLSGS